MKDQSKVVLLLAVQLRRSIEFIEAHRNDFDVSDDEELFLRELLHTYHVTMSRCGREFDKEIDMALFDMVGGYVKA